MRSILYLGWIGFHNLGDEWMWEVFRDLAADYVDDGQARVIPSVPGVDWKNVGLYDTVVLGGGSLLIPGYVELMHEALERGKQAVIWGSGHDRLHRLLPGPDGGIMPDPAVESEPYRKKLAELLKQSAYSGVRGPWTIDYLASLGAPVEHVAISGDPALLMTSSLEAAEGSRQKRGRGAAPVIGINWGTSYNKIYGGNETEVEEALAAAGKALIHQGYRLYLYGVWGPDGEALTRLYRKIGDPEHTTLDTKVYKAAEYVQLLSEFTATINFKLHANLLSAAANVPFVCIGYRFKSFDLMAALGLADYIVAANDPRLADRLVERTVSASAHFRLFAEKLEAARTTAQDSLTRPFREGIL